MSIVTWLRDTRAVYLDNATSTRDYRVQLRGNRSVMLFGIYLVILIGTAVMVYNGIAQYGQIEVVEAQRRLRDFYGVIMALLGGVVSLVAPALSATTVVTERQRRSLDLVFSAPVSPKYFLVGKMISSYRYTWMLLVLSLPITAACVVLGGASWVDVLTCYLLLSLHALILTGVALLMSTVASKPVPAILWSYAATIVYLFFTAALATPVLARSFMGGRTSGNEAPFYATLNPFLVQMSGPTYTMVGTVQVPNWVFTACVAALVCKICLLGAGSLLSPRPYQEIRSLRVHALVYTGAFLLYLAWTSASLVFGTTMTVAYAGRYLAWSMMPLFLFMPFLSTFGIDAERRFWPNGLFRFRNVLDGTPAGGLPFVLLFIGSSALCIVAGFWFGTKTWVGTPFLNWVVYVVGFWTFFWAVGRYLASTFVGVRSARTLQFGAFILLIVLPFTFLNSITDVKLGDSVRSIWDAYPLRPLFVDIAVGTNAALLWGVGSLVVGLVIAVMAERRTAAKMALIAERHEAAA